MPAIRKKRRSRSFFRTAVRPVLPWLLIAAGVAGLGWFFYFLTTIGPSRTEVAAIQVKTPDDPAVAKLSDAITELEKQYQKAADANLVTPEAIDKLAQAFDKQRELLNIYPNAGPDQSARLMRLDTELGSARAKLKIVEIDRLQNDGQDALENSDSELAAKKFSEALRLQREVNTSSAASRYKNYVRETSLAQQLAGLAAAPLARQVKAAVASARKAAAEKRWADALSAYMTARDLQDRINRNYARTVYSDLSMIDSLDAEIESLNASGVASDIDAKEKAGDQAVADHKPAVAAAFFADAGALQLEINQKFPRSRFVSSDRVESLDVKRQTALSTATADALDALNREIDGHLRKRQIVLASQKIGSAMDMVDKLFADYPKSRRIDGALKLKLAYLALQRPELRALQDRLYDQLLPFPGAADRLLLKTEVSQALYQQVMNTNPSRNPGRLFPVDSVNWDDAREFCTRLGWLLGLPVRLPSQDEFRVALGSGREVAWSSANSGGHSREAGSGQPNEAGFYDLLGNLAEWTQTTASDDKAIIFGGSYLDAPDTLMKVPTEPRLKSDRARHIGFRVLVERSAS